LVTQLAIIEVVAGILKLRGLFWQLALCEFPKTRVGKDFDRFDGRWKKPAWYALVKISAKLYTSVTQE
jgi:hypothetical protein